MKCKSGREEKEAMNDKKEKGKIWMKQSSNHNRSSSSLLLSPSLQGWLRISHSGNHSISVDETMLLEADIVIGIKTAIPI